MDLSFNNAKVLIVGGAGFVGSNLAHQILESSPHELIIVDNLISSEKVNIPDSPNVTFLESSINNNDILANLPDDLDFVFHLACYHGNQSSIADPMADHENNTLTSLKLFKRISEIKSIKKVVYAAAACAVAEKTYDDPTATTEEQPVSLYHDSPYSISKIAGELYGNYFFQQFGLPFVKARFSNVYGPREILGAGQWRGTIHTVWRNVIPTFIWKSMNGEALPLDNGGNASRDFIFVEDMARGLICCALKGSPGEIYNLATGEETSILKLATLINDLTNNKTPIDLKPARDWDRSGKRFASTEKAFSEIGFRSMVDIKNGITKTIDWTKSHIDIIEENILKHQDKLNF